MPHITIEYSSNLSIHIDFLAFMQKLHGVALSSGVFPLRSVRSYLHRLDNYLFDEPDAQLAFIRIQVLIAPGRDMTVRKHLADTLFQEAEQALLLSAVPVQWALQLEVKEFDGNLTRRRSVNQHNHHT